MFPRPMLPILALMAAGCGSDNPAPPPAAVTTQRQPAAPAPARPAASRLVRGIVKLSPTLTFQSCDAGTLMGVLDSTGDRLVSSYRFMHASEPEGMYVLARGEATAQGQMVLHEMEFAGRPSAGGGCEQPAPDYLILIRGMEPEWSLKLTEADLEFSQANQPEPISFPVPVPDDSAGYRRYQTASAGGVHTLHLLLSRTSCSEGRTGVYAAYVAAAVIDGTRLRGCGWRGRLP